MRDRPAQFPGPLRSVCALAGLKMNRLLDTFDAWAQRTGVNREVDPVERLAPAAVGDVPGLGLGLGNEMRTVVRATGFRMDYSWLGLPVFDRKSVLKHDRGVVDAPGLHVSGRPCLRQCKSSFMHGAGDDLRELGAHLAGHLEDAVAPQRAARAQRCTACCAHCCARSRPSG